MVNSNLCLFCIFRNCNTFFYTDNNHNVLLISKNKLKKINPPSYLQINDYLKDYKKIKNHLNSIRIMQLIIFLRKHYMKNRPT